METEKYIEKLKVCQTEKEFKKLWDSEEFDWFYSNLLCEYCFKYFNIWWNSEKFSWEIDSDYLCKYCSDYFNIWWHPKKFRWSYLEYLQNYCSEYKNIWEKDYIKWKLKNI